MYKLWYVHHPALCLSPNKLASLSSLFTLQRDSSREMQTPAVGFCPGSIYLSTYLPASSQLWMLVNVYFIYSICIYAFPFPWGNKFCSNILVHRPCGIAASSCSSLRPQCWASITRLHKNSWGKNTAVEAVSEPSWFSIWH